MYVETYESEQDDKDYTVDDMTMDEVETVIREVQNATVI
jgi:hypothetical protein